MKKITFRFTKASGFRSRSTVVSQETATAIEAFLEGKSAIIGTEENGTGFMLTPNAYNGAILEVSDAPEVAAEPEGEEND